MTFEERQSLVLRLLTDAFVEIRYRTTAEFLDPSAANALASMFHNVPLKLDVGQVQEALDEIWRRNDVRMWDCKSWLLARLSHYGVSPEELFSASN